MNYRVYQNVSVWEYVTTTTKEGLIRVVSSFKDDIYIMIVQHDISLDMDECYYRGYAGDYEEKHKILTKTR